MALAEVLSNFVAITGSDMDLAKRFLELSNGNLESAVNLYFETGGVLDGGNSNTNTTSDTDLASRLQEEAYNEADVRAPLQPVHQRLVEDPYPSYDEDMEYNYHLQLQRLRNNSRMNVFNQVARNSLSDDEDEDDSFMDAFDSNPELTAHERKLAKLFAPPSDIVSNITLLAAKVKGRKEKKFILINIQDNADFRCQVLNRDFWSNTQIKQVVFENFIFLQYTTNDPQGSQYIQYNQIITDSTSDDSQLPHVAILDPYSGERFKEWSVIMPTINEWLEEVHEFLNTHSLDAGATNPPVFHNHKINYDDLSEEQQIKLAMKKSLEHENDGEESWNNNKQQNRYNIISLDSDDESEPEFLEDENENEKENDTNSNNDIAIIDTESTDHKSTNNYKMFDNNIEEEEEEEEGQTNDEKFATILAVPHEDVQESSTRIQIRFPDGSRIIHKFGLDEKVRVIYEYLKSLDKDIIKSKLFYLLYQRTNLIEKLNLTIQEAGLKNASIMVDID